MPKTEFRFYHLQRTPLPRALGDLAAKAVSMNRKILVVAPNDAAAKALDDGLWTFRQDAFLAHGIDGDPDPNLTPVWISANENTLSSPPNGADTLILTGGATAPTDPKFALVCDMFDGNDATQLEAARGRWAVARDAGHAVSYYQQTDTGGWEQKA